MKLKNTAPYIIMSFINWLNDSGGQPRIKLKNSDKNVFPPGYHLEPYVLFNVEDAAIQNLLLNDDGISFSARFSGKECSVYAPLDCVVSLHSKDGNVTIPFNNNTPPLPRQVTPIGYIETKIPVKLSIIQGDSLGNGIPSGKLVLV